MIIEFYLYPFSNIDLKKHKFFEILVHLNIFNRLKLIMKNLITLLYSSLVELNIFLVRDFGSNIDRTKVKSLGQWATRLFIVLFAVGLAILTLYTIVRPETFTKNFDEPSFNLYKQLFQRYGGELTCKCSSIASTYHRFVNIEARFHDVSKNYYNKK